MPRVSIGVPVYNGASLIRQSLSNLAEQSFRDFDVVISDNASTDGTTEICEDFARKDPRFRVVRRDVTSTAMQNFLFVRRQTQSPLFMWRAFDDLSTPNFIQELVAVHDAQPGIALAAPAILRRFGTAKPDRIVPYPSQPSGSRVSVLLHRMRWMQAGWFYGLWRLEAAEAATDTVYAQFPDGWAADYLALLHAALHGGIAGTNACAFHQQLLADMRGYMPRPKPTYRQMVDRNRRFSTTSRALLDDADLSSVEYALLRAYVPLFTNRCCHRAKRLLPAAARQLIGR